MYKAHVLFFKNKSLHYSSIFFFIVAQKNEEKKPLVGVQKRATNARESSYGTFFSITPSPSPYRYIREVEINSLT